MPTDHDSRRASDALEVLAQGRDRAPEDALRRLGVLPDGAQPGWGAQRKHAHQTGCARGAEGEGFEPSRGASDL